MGGRGEHNCPEQREVPSLLIWAKQTGRVGLIYAFSFQPLRIQFKICGAIKFQIVLTVKCIRDVSGMAVFVGIISFALRLGK